jgi:hypothetical protein
MVVAETKASNDRQNDPIACDQSRGIFWVRGPVKSTVAKQTIEKGAGEGQETGKWKDAFKWLRRIAVFVGISSVATSFISAYYLPKVASFLSRKHEIEGLWTEWQPLVVSCTVWSMTFIPKQSITHLDIFIHFAQEYHDVLIRPVRPDLSGQKPRYISGDVAVKDTCDFNEPSTPNSANFSVIRYNNRTDIKIKGADLQPDDTYTVLVLFHPDFMIGTTGWRGRILSGTYTAYGQEVPAFVNVRNPPVDFGPIPDDMPEIPSEFDQH